MSTFRFDAVDVADEQQRAFVRDWLAAHATRRNGGTLPTAIRDAIGLLTEPVEPVEVTTADGATLGPVHPDKRGGDKRWAFRERYRNPAGAVEVITHRFVERSDALKARAARVTAS